MTPESRHKLRNLLIDHESYRQFPYMDTTGHLSIGIGRNITDRGISQSEALILLDDDIQYFSSKLSRLFHWFDGLDDNRKICLVDLIFNLGVNGFCGFTRMLAAIENDDFETCSEEILSSKAALQCPERYQQLAHIMRTGEL